MSYQRPDDRPSFGLGEAASSVFQRDQLTIPNRHLEVNTMTTRNGQAFTRLMAGPFTHSGHPAGPPRWRDDHFPNPREGSR
jgi:hypothetical protein